MTQPMMITGIVTDPSGTPVAGAVVAIAAAPVPVPDIAALTGEDGRFSIMVPVAGGYRLQVRGDRSTAEVAISLPRDDREIEVQLPG